MSFARAVRTCGSLVLGAAVACGPVVARGPAAPLVGAEKPTAFVPGDAASGRDPTVLGMDALGYELELATDDFRPGSESFRARALVTLITARDVVNVRLDFEGNTVESVRVGTDATSLAPANWDRRDGNLVVAVDAKAGHPLVIETRYRGAFVQTDGRTPANIADYGGLTVRQHDAEGRRIFTTLGWPQTVRRYLPVHDDPADGAMFVAHVTFPAELTVLANGTRTGVETRGPFRTWHYAALTPMPAYDFKIAAYDHWQETTARAASGVAVVDHVYSTHVPARATMLGHLPAAVDFFEKRLGPYRFGPSVRFTEVPIFEGGMEDASIISLDESLFRTPAAARQTVVHELAHQWAGNLVRIRSWRDFWMSEGMSEYLAAAFILHHDGDVAGRRQTADYLRRALAADAKHPVRPDGRSLTGDIDILRVFDDVSYCKGARVLRMLEAIVGTDAWWAFLRKWFDDHAFAAMSTMDFERELVATVGPARAPAITAVFDGFVYASGIADVAASLAPTDREAVVTLARSGVSSEFPVTVEVTTEAGPERVTQRLAARETVVRIPTRGRATTVVVDPDDVLYGTTHCDTVQKCKPMFSCARGVCTPE